MKRIDLLFGLLIASGFLMAQTASTSSLWQLSKQCQFEKMDSLNEKTKGKDYFFYKGIYANVCNQPGLSNKYLD